jgi:hypothetical protein
VDDPDRVRRGEAAACLAERDEDVTKAPRLALDPSRERFASTSSIVRYA